ncbi:transcriptional regulator, LacI family [bacterium A37T11]|nr:transcriptional regulator, LacI family [bacterium A37T11]
MVHLTLRDIAKALDLSVSTVSKALRDSYEIGEKTKKRVNEYARQHHYYPNRMAQSLKEGKTGSIGVVVCSLDNTFVAQMLDGIDKVCTANGYNIIIMQSKESHSQEKACTGLLQARGIDGLLISPASETPDVEHLLALQRASLPIVLFDRLSNDIDTHKVGIDNFQAAYQATHHLIECGYTRIAHLNSDIRLNITSERLGGYKKALYDHSIAFESTYVSYCNYSSASQLAQDIREALKRFMNLPNPPHALFTAGDQITTKSIGIIHELGYQIPADIALIGFSNTELASSLYPPLSTIYQPAYEIGQLAAEKLIMLIKDQGKRILADEFETIKLPTRLDIRSSSHPFQKAP